VRTGGSLTNGPSPAQLEIAKRLLAHEGAAGSADECASAAGRVYDKLQAHLSPLLGAAGVEALFVRSVKLTHREFSFLEVALHEGSTKLRERLRAQDAAVAAESAAALFGTFFALVTSFIGERLTTQALRHAWPTIEEMAPRHLAGDTRK
jgi:hypothetical protein